MVLWECPEAVFKEKHGVKTNKQKMDDEGRGPWECPEAECKEKRGVF